mgnify:CR=1 FL=1
MQPKTIIIPYKPRNWARQLHSSNQRWKVIICHRRAGKTVATLNHLQKDALQIPNSRFAFIAPTYKQAKDIAWDLIKFYARVVPSVQFNESELRIDYPNGSRIRLYGADNPDSLRGIGLWGVVFDEYSQQPSNIFSEIISKALAEHNGYAIWIGTIKGKNHLYKTYKVGENNAEWFTLWQDIDKTLITETGETVNNLKKALEDDKKLVKQGIMTEDEFKQEWYLNVEASIKGAVYAKEWAELRESGRLMKIDYDPLLPTYSAWDFGIGDATAIGIYQIQASIKREIRLIDYYENNNVDLQHYLDWLKNKPYKLIMSYGDPSGQNKNLITGRSLFEDLNSDKVTKFLGYPIRMFARRTHKIDQKHDVKRLMKELWVDEQLEKFIKAITNYHYIWDEKRGEFQKDPYHDWSSHAMDSLAYFAVNFLVPKVIDPIQQRINALTNIVLDLSSEFYANKV